MTQDQLLRGTVAIDRLDGYRVGVTSDRRSEDLIAAFERRGAEVIHAPTIRMRGTEDLGRLEAETAAIIAARPDVLLATTSYGIRRWFEAADAAGIGPDLVDTCHRARILVRGPKARGAIRAAGLDDDGMGEQETTESLVDLLLREDVAGLTIAVQLHGVADMAQLDRLERAGAVVLSARPYTWVTHEDQARVNRLVQAVAKGGVDAVTFTSAPAAEAFLHAAAAADSLPAVVDAFRGVPGAVPVLAAAVGPVTAEPLREHDIDPLVPERFRMGALIRCVCDELLRRERSVRTELGTLRLRGRRLELQDTTALLGPTALSLVRTLMDADGGTVTRARLSAATPEVLDDHGVDTAISRLRKTMGNADVIQTVVKRGYRLRTD
ncbi:uroporphyrinogen-III synthase [Microbacterium sp. SORGH_AS_0888]|uniref:uroporphyrinogen-III synthase n=1 Tax=Microbacterium sp. SORGH_AS_0888 TaxID=3041791 RepID=UPI00277D8750|nr:uroporphyrinogen-III synthase [Microbacterium sp. SORGH_AS_0888]MDQ1130357.1 uroporphyrinogen-III synthase [Microbacterium sp. SORGH_AS_0888]